MNIVLIIGFFSALGDTFSPSNCYPLSPESILSIHTNSSSPRNDVPAWATQQFEQEIVCSLNTRAARIQKAYPFWRVLCRIIMPFVETCAEYLGMIQTVRWWSYVVHALSGIPFSQKDLPLYVYQPADCWLRKELQSSYWGVFRHVIPSEKQMALFARQLCYKTITVAQFCTQLHAWIMVQKEVAGQRAMVEVGCEIIRRLVFDHTSYCGSAFEWADFFIQEAGNCKRIFIVASMLRLFAADSGVVELEYQKRTLPNFTNPNKDEWELHVILMLQKMPFDHYLFFDSTGQISSLRDTAEYVWGSSNERGERINMRDFPWYLSYSLRGLCTEAILARARAEWSMKHGFWEEAIMQCEKALLYAPDDFKTYLLRGLIFLKQQKWESAHLDFDKAMQLQPLYAAVYFMKALTYEKQNKVDLAIQWYTTVIQQWPYIDEAYANRGNLFLKSNRKEEALRDLNVAIRMNPQNPSYWNTRGVVYAERRCFIEAVKDCTHALVLNPGYVQAYINRAHVFRENRCYPEAEKDYRQALLVDEDSAIGSQTRRNVMENLQYVSFQARQSKQIEQMQ